MNRRTCAEDTESIPKIMDRHYAQKRRDDATVRDLCKAMRFAVNALDDGLPRLAQEILGDALRTYGEEQP